MSKVNEANNVLLSGQCTDPAQAFELLLQACNHELSVMSNDDSEETRSARRLFRTSVEQCERAVVIAKECREVYLKELRRRLQGAGLWDHLDAVEADDYKRLGF